MKQPQAAIRPDSFVDYRQIIERAKPQPKEPELIEEKQLAALAESDGWHVLKKYITELQTDLGNINKSMMERGASFDEIGKNAVIVQLANELLLKIVQKVSDAAEAESRRPR